MVKVLQFDGLLLFIENLELQKFQNFEKRLLHIDVEVNVKDVEVKVN